MNSNQLANFTVLLVLTVACLYQTSFAFSVKMVPDMKRAESNYKWFKLDKDSSEAASSFPSKFQEIPAPMDNENVPLPLALRMLNEKRGMFDLGTGRGYSGLQAIRGNLGLAFASPGSHGRK